MLLSLRSYLACLFILCTVHLCAGSVRLYNNSTFDLRAVVRGSDGSYLGEIVVKAQNTSSWTDSYVFAGGYLGPNAQIESGYRSKTPYVVIWYCMDGKDFAVCDTVSNAAVVMALSCAGSRTCAPANKKRGAYPQIPGGQYLQPQEKPP